MEEETQVETAPAENPGGENPGGENPGGENPGCENPDGENPGGENPGGENPGGENPGAGGGDAAPAAARVKSLLDDDEEAPEQEAAGADPAKVAEFRSGIQALDLGDGVSFDDPTFDAFAPELMAVTGGDPKKAEPLVRAYVGHVQKLERARQEAEDAFNGELVRQCQQRFGADLKKVAAFAKRGGREIFGERIWNEMKKIESFANNPDIMERLAMIGERFSEDRGAVHPAGNGPADTRDVISRMYGGVKK